MGLLAQLFGYGQPASVDGERSLTDLTRTLGFKAESVNRLTAAYVLAYCQEAMDKIADSDWDGADRLYEMAIRQIPQGIANNQPFVFLRLVLSYNALVCRLMRDGLTTEHEKELANRIYPPKVFLGGRSPSLPDPLWEPALFLLATLRHNAKRYDDAVAGYADIATPLRHLGREAAVRLRSAANGIDLAFDHYVPGVFPLGFQLNAAKQYTLSVGAPARFRIFRTGEQFIPRLDVSTLQQGIAFEEKCAALLRAMGFATQTTEKTGDGGIDILCYANHPMLSGLVVVQCKDWQAPVGEPVLRDLYGVVSARQAIKGICITSGSFTEQARKFAKDLQLELIDGAGLNFWMGKYSTESSETEEVAASVDRDGVTF